MGSNRPPNLTAIYPRRSGFRACDRMVPSWLQDDPKSQEGSSGGSWAVLGGSCLGPLLGALGLSLEGLGGLLGRLEEVLGQSGWVLDGDGSAWVVLGPTWGYQQ